MAISAEPRTTTTKNKREHTNNNNNNNKEEVVIQKVEQSAVTEQDYAITSFVNSLPQGIDARQVIKAIKEKNRSNIVHDIVKEKFALLGTMFNAGATIEEIEPVARSLVNYMNEEKKFTGKHGKRGRKPQKENHT